MNKQIQLSDHFGYGRLLRFTMPSIIMMIFTSIYGMVDGFFVSNWVGNTEFASVNFIFPFIMMVGAFGFMFGTGGAALISKTLGEGEKKRAQSIFSLIVYATIVVGVVLSAVSMIFIRPIAIFLGAEGDMIEQCVIYGRIILATTPALMIQFATSPLFIVAEKPKLGLAVTVVAGVTNMVGDALFMAVFRLGIFGAGLATALGQLIGGIIPIIYFSAKNSTPFRLGKTELDLGSLFKVCINGSSELMSNISMSVIGMLYNAQLMKYAGQDGVSAYGTIMYVNFIFIAIFIGYSTGISPVVSFHYGAGNTDELKSLLKKSTVFIVVCSVAMFAISEFLGRPLASIFVGKDPNLLDMTAHAFSVYAFSFFFTGIAIFGSAFFTALNDGLTSALISFLRTLLFQGALVLILPLFFKLEGIWVSIVFAELLSVIMTVIFLFIKRKKYQYM